MTRELTDKEWEQILLGREIKTRSGHGTLTVEYRNGIEALFTPAPKLVPKK